jgi:hypothetical protein
VKSAIGVKTTTEKVRVLGEAIQKVLQEHPGGQPNVTALGQITALADEARHASGGDAYVCEKVSSIKSFSAILYSARKHRKYDEGFPNGSDKVRSFIFGYAQRLRNWAGTIQDQAPGEG